MVAFRCSERGKFREKLLQIISFSECKSTRTLFSRFVHQRRERSKTWGARTRRARRVKRFIRVCYKLLFILYDEMIFRYFDFICSPFSSYLPSTRLFTSFPQHSTQQICNRLTFMKWKKSFLEHDKHQLGGILSIFLSLSRTSYSFLLSCCVLRPLIIYDLNHPSHPIFLEQPLRRCSLCFLYA